MEVLCCHLVVKKLNITHLMIIMQESLRELIHSIIHANGHLVAIVSNYSIDCKNTAAVDSGKKLCCYSQAKTV